MLINKIKKRFSNEFVRNLSFLAGGEFLNRVFRLVTTVVIARLLSPHDYGLAAIIFTVREFAVVLSLKFGIASKLIQANEKDLDDLINTSYCLNWIFCILIFILQCAAAFPLALFYKSNEIILPICVVAFYHLIVPNFVIQWALIERENRMNLMALTQTTDSAINNLITLCLAASGMGLWAIVLPSVISSPFIWLFFAYKYSSWRPKRIFTLYRWKEIFVFCRNILTVQLLDNLRNNLDYLIVGRFLGINALGIYYFAFNAGLGISLSVINSFIIALLPHLCAARGNLQDLKKRYFDGLKTIAAVFLPLVIVQSSLAPFYVPIIFGQKWVVGIPVLVLICLSALPRPFAIATSTLLQAIDRTDINVKWSVIFTTIFALSILIAVKWGIVPVAVAVLVSHFVAMPIFTIWGARYAIKSNS
ncbi:probable polysaccharide biosynthesis protein [Rivularia sp. IAM M-261]|nr:probable polysaccharide biosynthesis protein [Calothrix sp. PCC 7716]GJD23844.1 probable polysaccharide biosynthesis protein [Rivularia sp. IAM M-261]